MSYETYDAAYGPVIWLEDHSTYFGSLDGWYQNLWYSEYDEWKRFIDHLSAGSVNTNQAAKKNE